MVIPSFKMIITNIQTKYKEAKIAAKESLRIKQNYAPAFFELGLAEMNLCNIVAAKDAFEKAREDSGCGVIILTGDCLLYTSDAADE